MNGALRKIQHAAKLGKLESMMVFSQQIDDLNGLVKSAGIHFSYCEIYFYNAQKFVPLSFHGVKIFFSNLIRCVQGEYPI